MLLYIALIRKDAESDYGVSFPDLPGCVTAGSTLDEARLFAVEALALHLEGLAADGDPVPEPSSLESVMADRDNLDGVAILVAAPTHASKAVRLNITLQEELLKRIDAYAESHGLTRSGLLAQAARRVIEEGEPVRQHA